MIRFVLSLALAAPVTAPTLPPGLQAHAAMLAGEHAKAAKAYAVAFELYGDPKFLWGMAEALRKDGRCEDAVGLYEAYLELPVPDDEREDVMTGLARCKVAKVRIEGPFAPPPPPLPPRATDEFKPYDPPASPEWRERVDPVGLGLVAGGVVMSAIGAGLLSTGKQLQKSAVAEDDEASFQEAEARGARRAIVGGSVLALGLTTVAVGAVHWVIRNRRRADRLSLKPGSVRVRF